MNTFTFISDTPMDVVSATKAIRGWMLRRAFPTKLLVASEFRIVVALQAPHNGIHNRSVNSLGRILQRQLDRQHFVESRLVPTLSQTEHTTPRPNENKSKQKAIGTQHPRQRGV